MPGGGGNPNPPDKPGEFKVRSYEDADQAKAKIDDLVAKGKEFVVIVTTYKEEKSEGAAA